MTVGMGEPPTWHVSVMFVVSVIIFDGLATALGAEKPEQ